MSRILRRPMFRGGPVDSRGSGITSGLMDGGRVGYKNAGSVTGMDFLKKALGPRFTDPNFKSPMVFPKNVTPFNFGQSPKDYANALSEGSSYREYLESQSKPQEFETEVTESGDVKFKLDEKGDKIPIETEDLSLKETIEKKRIEDITAKDTQGMDLVDLGLSKKSDLPGTNILEERADSKKIKKAKNNLENVGSGDGSTLGKETEESTEFTVKDYIKMLGGDKARRRDLSDMLAGASAAFLGTGSVKEGLAQFMAKQAESGPSRLEKIEQAAATLDIKDKIDSKRAKEKIELMKENTLFELRAKSDALKAAGDISKMNAGDALTYISKEIYRGQKDRSSSRVLKTFLDIKLNTDSNVKNVGDLTSFLNDAEEVANLPEGITIVTSDQGKRVYLKRGDKVELVDINKL